MQFDLPEDLTPELRQFLEDNREMVESTIKPYIAIKLFAQPDLNLWQSKIGGKPYLPKTVEYPKGKDALPLQFLAQLNFAEIPNLPDFPQTGLLQFYIAGNDELYGANFENPTNNNNFRVLYFAELETDEKQLITNFDFLPEFEGPVQGSAGLQFEKKFMPISVGDYQFSDRLGDFLSLSGDELRWEYEEKVFIALKHQIGGYPSFTQTDPREYKKAYQDYDCLLLQLDSDELYEGSRFQADLMWGDMGIANFFIKFEALKQQNFADILFNWDCG